MKLLPSSENLAGACARHPWRTIVLWVVVLAILGTYGLFGLNDVLTNQFEITANVDAIKGYDILNESSLGAETTTSETLVVTSKDGTTVDDQAFQDLVNSVVNDVRTLQGKWIGEGPLPPPNLLDLANGNLEGSTVINYYELRAFNRPEINQLVSEDRTALIIPITFEQLGDAFPVKEFIDTVETHDNGQFDVTAVGQQSLDQEFRDVIVKDLLKAEVIGVPIAVAVLVLVFGALLAPALPFVLAIFAVGIALGIVTVIGQIEPQQLFIQNVVSMLGLAIGLDYSLFIVARYREQRTAGFDKIRAVEIAGGTAGKAVLFSGVTVMLSMLGVMFVQLNIFTAIGVGAIIVVACSLALTSTLLPAMIGLLGDHINWPREKAWRRKDSPHVEDMYAGFWGRLTSAAVARPWVTAILSTAFLLLLASPALGIHTGFESTTQFPPGESATAYKVMSSKFAAGLLAPIDFIVAADRTDATDAALNDFVQALEDTNAFARITPITWDDTNTVAHFSGTTSFASSSEQGYDLIRTIREDLGPSLVDGPTGGHLYVSGIAPTQLHMLDMLKVDMPIVFAFVLGLSFLLLMISFRSLVVPIQAIFYNLLSVGATYGVLNQVFAKGWLRDQLNYTASPTIEAWLPILLFCILFGLSMDYHVFLLSRIREHYDLTQNNAESVAIGLRTTGKIITGAATIMVVIFISFSQGSLLSLQQFGFGLAVAVALDATIVRTMLVPAVMTIVGNRNWYLPRWLHWLPDLRIEGTAPHSVQEDIEAHAHPQQAS